MNESSIRYPGWRVALACFTMTLFGFGFGFYGHSVYFAELTTRGDGITFAASTVSAAVTVSYLTSALMMAFTSDLMTRLGPRVFAMTGAATMGLSNSSSRGSIPSSGCSSPTWRWRRPLRC
jgi:hypothetical protein